MTRGCGRAPDVMIPLADLSDLLRSLDGVRQDPRYHPEGDALTHSLQAFDCARHLTRDRTIWASALLHDVGKALGSPAHDATGADLLEGLVCPRIVWLVRHHLDLLRAPGATRRRWRRHDALRDLELLRRCDTAGRRPGASFTGLDEALAIAAEHPAAFALDGEGYGLDDDSDARWV